MATEFLGWEGRLQSETGQMFDLVIVYSAMTVLVRVSFCASPSNYPCMESTRSGFLRAVVQRAHVLSTPCVGCLLVLNPAGASETEVGLIRLSRRPRRTGRGRFHNRVGDSGKVVKSRPSRLRQGCSQLGPCLRLLARLGAHVSIYLPPLW
ncbi:hypothetical protein BDV95DRAFT_223177 [Massariosphaeria phaeospora]|uniref:Uncharacterized protein n=1 Tax=Massariosphaeria phaeospora TaxID=100035 RepID=A0A7C8MFH0_9PLEO|nr:hypothetical protein BDV95DRAFT_223177 [Massariosphaeria phaeospora]